MGWTIRNDMPAHTAAGNVCYICRAEPRRNPRTGKQEPLLDPSIHIEFEGHMIICSHCIIEAATMLGMMTESASTKLKEDSAELYIRMGEMQMRAVLAEEALQALRRYDLVKEPYDSDTDSGSSVPALTFDPDLAGEELDEGTGNSSFQRSRGRSRKW